MLKLANVFSNHMVLQRDKNIAVWGECDQTKVTGECNGKKVTTSVEDGRFMLYFPPMEAEMLAPFPRWQTITFAFSGSRLPNLIASPDTNIWLVPWKP